MILIGSVDPVGMGIPVVVIGITFSMWLEELPTPAMVPVLVMAESSDGGEVAGGASHRFSASLWIGLGLGVGNSGGDEPRTLCPWSPPPLYSTARQGPTSLAWAGRPRSGRGSRAQ